MLETSTKMSPLQDPRTRSKLIRIRFLQGKFFLSLGMIALLVLHLLIIIPAILLYYFVASIYCISYSIVAALALAIIFCISILILFILIKRFRVRESFHIVTSISINIVMIVLYVPPLIVYTGISLSIGMIENWNAGYITYWFTIAIDVTLILLLDIDFFLYVVLVVFFFEISHFAHSSVTFPALLTFKWSRQNAADIQQNGLVRQVLADSDMHTAFFQFAIKEFNTENILFYGSFKKKISVQLTVFAQKDSVSELMKQKLSVGELLANTKLLYDDFVDPSGPFALNVTQTHIVKFKNAMAAEKEEDLRAAFDSCMEKVVANMMDTFSRFSRTDTYKKWHEHHQMTQSARQKLGWS